MNTATQKKQGYGYKRENLLTAIAILPDPLRPGHMRGVKYRNIRHQVHTIVRFEAYIRRAYPTATHINYYTGVSKQFLERTTL